MKRFYKQVTTKQSGSAWRILLDGRPVKTPALAELAVPTQSLAEAMASEWAEQGDTVDIQGMHLTRLTNVAIDRTPSQREGMIDEVVKYCETDLLCFLAETPADLRDRQISQWRPVRDWAGKHLDVVYSKSLMACSRPRNRPHRLMQRGPIAIISAICALQASISAWGCSARPCWLWPFVKAI